MIYRWIYKIWRYFWYTFFALAGLAIFLILLAGGLLQLPQSKNYIKAEVVSAFNRQFEGRMDIDEIHGFLPFQIRIAGGEIYAPSDTVKPVVSFGEANVTMSWWELLQQQVSVSSFEVQEPVITLGAADGTLTLLSAITQREDRPRRSGDGPRLIDRLDIFAPSLSITNGTILVDSSVIIPPQLELNPPFEITNLNTSAFVEVTDSLIFADILEVRAEIPDSRYEFIEFGGQFYNDEEFFELNSFHLGTATGRLEFTLEVSPVNLYSDHIREQFRQASYRFDVRNSNLNTALIRQFAENYPDFPQDVEIEMTLEGTAEELFIDRFRATLGESSLILTADARNLLGAGMDYDSRLENIVLHPDQLRILSETYLAGRDLSRYDLSTLTGTINGSFSGTNAGFLVSTEAGSLELDVELSHPDSADTVSYELLAEADSLDISPFTGTADSLRATVMQGDIALSGRGLDRSADVSGSFDLGSSEIFGYPLETLFAEFDYAGGRLGYYMRATDEDPVRDASFTASGSFRREENQYVLSGEGSLQNVDITRYIPSFYADQTNFNSTFSVNLQGNNIDDVYGRASFEMQESTINTDTLKAHQIYADINSPANEQRRLRFTSSFFDGEITGTIQPTLLKRLAVHWGDYIGGRISEEILFNPDFSLIGSVSDIPEDESAEAELFVDMNIKDLSLLARYFPEFPDLSSRGRLNTTIEASDERLLITGNLTDPGLSGESFSFQELSSSLTASFRHNAPLREYSTVDFRITSTGSSFREFSFKESFLNFSMRNDSISVSQHLERLTDDLRLESDFTGSLAPGELEFLVDQFSLGSSRYRWQAEGNPRITYAADGSVSLDQVVLTSDTDYVGIQGTFSPSFEDSVEYTIRDLDLSRISELIAGRVSFSGLMNGEFVSRTLSQIPSIHGDITITEGIVNDRLIGDITLSSSFNPEEERFDTDIKIFTDPEKYGRYLTNNDGIGQDLQFNGFFKLPNEETPPEEELFYFDGNLREIDMWIVTIIVPNIITDMQGRATATGYIRGTRENYNYDFNFDIHDTQGTPFFTNVEYTLNGDLDFNQEDGLLFREISLRDGNGGNGVLSGQVDLHDFGPVTDINLTMDLNNLNVINNPYDPDIPFYANLTGDGQIQITGTNLDPFLRTTTPMLLSGNSRISIPLEEETELNQDRRFIEFVDSFDLSGSGTGRADSEDPEEDTGTDEDPSEENDLSFTERVTMDLQFIADNPISVRLVFDRVTNDILDAEGTGQIRLLLEDQNLSMFGGFNILSGEYNFVSGDIFTRRFMLEEGGSINWQGDLADAGLDIRAIYRARPYLSSLGGITSTDPGGQRIPVELVLQIGGTITAVENDFFFRVPSSGIEGTLDPAISSQINTLNQNEEEKLLQATGILLTGNFVPTQDQGSGFGEGFSGTTAVVSPLVSSQIITPLLSNQINSLLNSDITFDIDFNINPFNEVDLDVALRLFNDRIILRREGQLTGEYSDIGDLGATYRINRTFSVTAFHRQDPTLTYSSGTENRQTQEMNGIGLEAQVQFNTWKDFQDQIKNSIHNLLGAKNRDDEDEPENENSILK